MNLKISRLSVLLSILVSLFAIFVSANGIFNRDIYLDVLKSGNINEFLLHGSKAQDIFMLLSSISLLIACFVFFRRPGTKKMIFILGILSYVFYGYALYSVQGMCTEHYFLYLVIFSLSIYAMISGFLSFRKDVFGNYKLKKSVKIISCVYLVAILSVLVPIWITFLFSDMQNHIPADTYGVFVLDLGLVFPAMAISVFMNIRGIGFGYVLNGVLLIKALTICLSVAFGELYIANVGKISELNVFLFGIFIVLGMTALLINFLFFKNLKTDI